MASMQGLCLCEGLVVLLTSWCILLHLTGVNAYDAPMADVRRSDFKPINCYFCDTGNRDCDSRLDAVKSADIYGAATGHCEWILPRPFRNGLIGIPLRPYCVTFVEEVRDYGKSLSYRLVRDCARPGGTPTDCMRFDMYPNMLTWSGYKSWENSKNENRFTVMRQAIFCNNSDYCNSMTMAEFETKCNTGALRTLDVGAAATAGNTSSAPAVHGASWLHIATLLMPAMLASRSAPFVHYVPWLMAATVLTPRVGLLVQADFLMYRRTDPKTLTCYDCNSAQLSACKDGDTLIGTNTISRTLSSGYVSEVLAGSLGLANRLDPACVTYIIQESVEIQGVRTLFAQYLVRRPVWMEGFPEECMNITDMYTKKGIIRGYSAVHIALFCWTDKCNSINQQALVDKCYPQLGQTDRSGSYGIITGPGWDSIRSGMRSMSVGNLTAPGESLPPSPDERAAGNGTGSGSTLFAESPSSILLLSFLLAAGQAVFTFKVFHLCAAF